MSDKYDLSSIEAISDSAKLARAAAGREPSQGSYNAAWLHGYAEALADTVRQLESRQRLADDKTIKILVVEPMKPCRVQEIGSDLESMQAIVGGYIEEVTPFNEPVAIVCNEEGKLQGLPYNRPLVDQNGLPYDILCGTFFIAGVEGEHFVSLTDNQIRTYKELYDNMMVLTAEKEEPQGSKQKKKGVNPHER